MRSLLKTNKPKHINLNAPIEAYKPTNPFLGLINLPPMPIIYGTTISLIPIYRSIYPKLPEPVVY